MGTIPGRFELIEAAVKDIAPLFTNETAAWNAWNILNTSQPFLAAVLAIHATPEQEPNGDTNV